MLRFPGPNLKSETIKFGKFVVVETIEVHLAVEGILDEIVLRRLLENSERPFQVLICLGKKGVSYLKKNLRGFNEAARETNWIVLMDLNTQEECAPLLVSRLLPYRNPRLLLRIAVREVESWLLADRENLARFLGISIGQIPSRPDELNDPKFEIIQLAKKSRHRELRESIAPFPGSTSKIGKYYNQKLGQFVQEYWSIHAASGLSPSLDRAIKALKKF